MVGHTSRVTLDIIGAAGKGWPDIPRCTNTHSNFAKGFGYDIGAIEKGDANELALAFNNLFANNRSIDWWTILTNMFPILGYLVLGSLISIFGCLLRTEHIFSLYICIKAQLVRTLPIRRTGCRDHEAYWDRDCR